MRCLHRISATLATSVLLIALATVAGAQGPKTAQEIMDFSTAKSAGYKTWSADYSQRMNMLGGQMSVDGQMIQKLPHKLWMYANVPMMGQQSKMTIVMGDDGILWEVMDIGAQRQIIKMDMSKVMSNAASQAGLKINPLDQMDPSKQWENSKQLFDFTTTNPQELDGQPMFVMEGVWKQAALTNQQMAMIVGMVGKSRVFIGQHDGFLHRMEQFDKSKTNLVMSMEFKNLKFNEDVPDSTFAYQPPANVQVMDMTPMLEMQMRSQSKGATSSRSTVDYQVDQTNPPSTLPAPAAKPATP